MCGVLWKQERDRELRLNRKRRLRSIDGRWQRVAFSNTLRCNDCGIDYPEPEPQLFNFNRPLGACPECEGFGNIVVTDMERVVPDPSKSIRDGAIAPWNAPTYAHELGRAARAGW